MKTFFNLFQKFLENKTELSEFFDLPVQSCKINRQSRIMIIQMLSKKYYNFQQITAVEKTIKKDFNLALAKVEFVYEDLPFSADYCEDIAELLKREHPKLNGFLNKAKYTFADDVLSIELQNGGLSVILDTGIDKLLKDYINGHFQTHIKINFGGITETTEKMLADNCAIAKPYVPPTPTTPPPTKSETSAPTHTSKPTTQKVNLPSLSGKSPEELGFYPDSAELVIGHAIRNAPTPISEVSVEDGSAVIFGKIFKCDSFKTKAGNRYIITMYITDYTGSYILKSFANESDYEKLNDAILGVKGGVWAIVKGDITLDTYENDYIMKPSAIMTVKHYEVTDLSENKRVELHMHTIMSSKDGMTPAEDLINTAYKWGHKAIAVTDHGVVQAFPNAMNAVEKIRKGGGEFKVIYGVEAYFVNDYLDVVTGESDLPIESEMIVFDVETTGLNPNEERLTEIGAVRIKDGEIVEEFDTFVNPEKPIPKKITELTGIDDSMVKDAPDEKTALEMFIQFAGDLPLIAHNAQFDISFIKTAAKRREIEYNPVYIDTLPMAKALLPNLKKHKLDVVAKELELPEFNHHRACDDARVLGQIYNKFIGLMHNVECANLNEINTKLALAMTEGKM